MGGETLRREHWPDLLTRYLTDSAGLEFRWGVSDCALWVCGWVEAATGADYAAPFRGKYDTEAGAAAILKEFGFSSLEDLAGERLVETPIKFTQRGDVVLGPTGALGVCNGIKSHFLSESGLIAIPTYSCVRAWRV